MDDTIGRRLVNLYQGSRTPFAILLLVLAFFAGRFDFGIGQDSALLAAALIVVLLLSDIHRHLLRREAKDTFSGFHDAAIAFRKRVERVAKTEKSLDIKWLGMSMEYGAPILDDIVMSVLRGTNLRVLRLQIHMSAPDWDPLSQANETWPSKARAAVTTIRSLEERAASATDTTEVQLETWFYRHVPNWHGFLVNDRFLYLGECTWEDGRLLGGENPYRFFDTEKNSEAARAKEGFLGWFEFCRQEPLLPRE